MAALSTCHLFYTKNNSIPPCRRQNSTTQICFSCQNREPISFSDPDKKKQEKNENKQLFLKLYTDVEKLGKGLKDSLSPKQKGDWKDVMLMSLSFAVYVYISQKIVCAYCAWMSMLKQPW